MRAWFVLGWVSLNALVGCHASDKTSVPAESASAKQTTPSAASQQVSPNMTVTINGKPVTMKTQLAYSEGGKTLRFEASTAELQCDDFKHKGRSLASGEQHFSLTLAPILQKDGSEKWGATYGYFGGMSRQGSTWRR